jgi:MoaA/NifB/PqqE/SkfB family radical SAM enzyme
MKVEEVQTIQIEPTSHCNALCPHCPRFDVTIDDVFKSDGTLHPDLTLDHIDIDAVIKNLELHNMPLLQKVQLCGDKGDPCMHPKIDQLIDTFASLDSNPLIMLNTNGSIRNTKWWSNLAKKNYKNFGVVFSIDGLADTNHLYRVGLNYNTIMKNTSAFINAGGHAIWKMIIFKHNEHQIEQAKILAEKLGFAEFRVVLAHQRFKGLDQWPVEFMGKTHYLSPTASDVREQTFYFKNTLKKPFYSTSKEKICPNLNHGNIYITHQHHIIPCCMMHFDTELKYPGRDQLLELTEGFDNQDISKLPLSVIFEQPFFKNKLLDSFKSGKLQHTCEKSCKSQIENNLANISRLV